MEAGNSKSMQQQNCEFHVFQTTSNLEIPSISRLIYKEQNETEITLKIIAAMCSKISGVISGKLVHYPCCIEIQKTGCYGLGMMD